jgi:hypothetical protein
MTDRQKMLLKIAIKNLINLDGYDFPTVDLDYDGVENDLNSLAYDLAVEFELDDLLKEVN